MTTAEKEIKQTNEMDSLKSRLKSTWMTGDYDMFSRYMEKGSEVFFRGLAVEPGLKMLDIGCGAGQLTLIGARAGVDATGCDIAPNWIEKARIRAAMEGLKAVFDEGDAESLPYENAHFDLVTSFVGAMFAPRPELVASEMIRVCKPGGTIAMANWTPSGFIGEMFRTIAKHIAPPGMPSPVLWGDEAVVRGRLSEGIASLRMTKRMFPFEYPFSPEAVVIFFRENYGPMSRAFTAMGPRAQNSLQSELTSLWSAHNKATDASTRVEAEYLEVTAVVR